MLKLVSTEITPTTEQRLNRLMLDVYRLQDLPAVELRAVYPKLETVRDRLSEILDRMDGKDV
jgi:hypothetical protein